MPSVLNVDNDKPDTLRFAFAGPARTAELNPVFEAIAGRLKRPPAKVRNVVFDLSTVDRLETNTGRILDMAEEYGGLLSRKNIEVELVVPRTIYEDLQRTDPLPDLKGSSVSYRGVHVLISDVPDRPSEVATAMTKLVELRRSQDQPRRIEILSCLGKIRKVAEDAVTVSLFSREGEIVGLFEPNQFPDDKLKVGMVFMYSAAVSQPGMTETLLRWMPERDISAADLEKIKTEVDSKIPPDGFQ